MKNKILILIILAGFLVSSCDELFEKPSGVEEDKTLEFYEELKTISQYEVSGTFAYLSALYPEALPIAAKAGSGVKIYKINYKTTFMGDTITASGLVSLPIGTGEYPIISFQNGTNTLHDNAPTENPDLEMYKFLEIMASTGFIVAIPDYIGFGESSEYFHPYLDKDATVQCTVDMLRATREMVSNHRFPFKVNNDLYITGYSMGGWATLQLQKAIETTYPDEFNLKASACASGPYNLLLIMNLLTSATTYPMPYFIGYILQSYINLGSITNDYSDIINEPYASRIANLYDGTHDGETINSQLTNSVKDLFTSDYLTNYRTSPNFASLRKTLLANSVEAWDIKTPLTFYHGTVDNFISDQVSDVMYDEFITKGVSEEKISLVKFDGLDHGGAVVPSGIAAIKWFLQIRDSEN